MSCSCRQHPRLSSRRFARDERSIRRSPTSAPIPRARRISSSPTRRMPDMASGLAATGSDSSHRETTLVARPLSRSRCGRSSSRGLVDIMLMSASTSDQLTIKGDVSSRTRASRRPFAANDTTLTSTCPRRRHICRGEALAPVSPATIEQIPEREDQPNTCRADGLGPDLGLYSITPNNKLEFDYPTLEAYREFRNEAELKGFRPLPRSICDPNACGDLLPGRSGAVH